MSQKTKFFVIGTEGATTDGRTIERAWLEQAAHNYDPKKYNARVNLEHFKGLIPDSPFKRYGDVIALKTEVRDNKMVLLAQIDPTPDLVSLSKARQKIHTSMEIDPNFADTGQAYLVGLAITDDPASLGTDMLQFCGKAPTNPLAGRKLTPHNLFSAATEATIELDADPSTPEKYPSVFTLLKAFFSEQGTEQQPSQVAPAPVATAQPAPLQPANPSYSVTMLHLAQAIDANHKAVDELRSQQQLTATALQQLTATLSATPQPAPTRPVATGQASYEQQDF